LNSNIQIQISYNPNLILMSWYSIPSPPLTLIWSYPSIAWIIWTKVCSSSFKPILNVGVLLDKFTNSTQVDWTNPCIASLIFFALDLVIGPSGTCKGSLRFDLPRSLEPTIKLKPTQESQESSQEDLDLLKSSFKNLDWWECHKGNAFDKFLVQ
jgi:hypothetical protein